ECLENNHEIDSNTPPAAGKPDDRAEKTPANSFIVLLKDFASDTSFGGISKITLSDGKIRRFLWLLISVTCYALTIMYCMSLVNNYLDKPIKTTVDISYEKNINFPSVTVCNLNQFRKSKLQEVKSIQDILQRFSNENRNTSDGSILEVSLKRLRKMLMKDLAHDDDDDDDLGDVDVDEDVLLEQFVAILASNYNKTHLKQVGHQFDDTILSCSWKGANCRTGYFAKFWVKHWNWKYGNCFTFNPGGNETGHKLRIIHTSGTGPHHGLSLDINIQQSSEYVDELTAEAGALITIHKAEQMPFPYDEGTTESITRVDPHNNGSCHLLEELPKGNIYRKFMGGSCTKYSVK
ncbi:amiloride-sensitive sodium channel subunit gamma-2-like, partial [Paramuricea clavata]